MNDPAPELAAADGGGPAGMGQVLAVKPVGHQLGTASAGHFAGGRRDGAGQTVKRSVALREQTHTGAAAKCFQNGFDSVGAGSALIMVDGLEEAVQQFGDKAFPAQMLTGHEIQLLPGSRAHDDRIQLQIVGGKQQERAFHFLQTFICIVESQFRP